jgi:CarD family transcriptional regulator
MSRTGKAESLFKVGEKVVYPAHGVGVIQSIQTRVVSGTEKTFYMLRILDSDMTIMIPTENVDSVGLRRVIGREMVTKVYKILREKRVEIDQQTWNRRYREYTEKIKTGSVLEIAKVLRDLFVLKGDKELSFGERSSTRRVTSSSKSSPSLVPIRKRRSWKSSRTSSRTERRRRPSRRRIAGSRVRRRDRRRCGPWR